MSEIIITVRGTARRELQPDRVTVHLAIDCESAERAAAYERAVRAIDVVTAALDARHDADTGPVLRWSLDQLALTAQRPWTGDGTQAPLAHRAHLRGSAELTVGGTGAGPRVAESLSALAELIDELSADDAVMIENLSWRLTDSHRSSAETEVRSRAVKDAVTKATVYAQSLGLGTVTPLALADPGMLGDAGAGGSPIAPFERAMMSADVSGGGVTLRTEPIVIDAVVDARFSAR